MRRTLLAAFFVIGAAVAGCYTGNDVTTTGGAVPDGPVVPVMSVDPTAPESSSIRGVPCDVAKVLAKDCATCHGKTPTGGAPTMLMSYDDLTAPSLTDPTVSAAQMSLSRMQDKKNPMPPDGAPAADLAILEAWITAGMLEGTEACDVTPAASIYATPLVCSTGTHWTRGDKGSAAMHPGVACNECHTRVDDGPSYSAAGTVFKTAHEPDDCNGTVGVDAADTSVEMTVVITDAAGHTFSSTVNSVGNFGFQDDIKMPYKAKVVMGKKSRAMSAAQTNGDCNQCHTQAGTTTDKKSGMKPAPGRVMAP